MFCKTITPPAAMDIKPVIFHRLPLPLPPPLHRQRLCMAVGSLPGLFFSSPALVLRDGDFLATATDTKSDTVNTVLFCFSQS
jgi:hypothetical protein